MLNAYEFQAAVTPDHKLSIPDALFGKFETHKTIRVIVLIDESADEEQAWAHLTAEQFFAGYDDSDAVYDQYRACSEIIRSGSQR
jgi:uncharacterized protein (DUF1810 family)